MTRAVPKQGLDIIKSFEGLHDGDKSTPILEPEADPIGIYTLGFGHALFQNGQPVKNREAAYRMWRSMYPNGMTLADANDLLRKDAQSVCDQVMKLIGNAPVTDNELGAMVSLAYNIGVGERGGGADFADSSVLRKFLAGDKAGAAEAFKMWRFAGGLELRGLIRRRRQESQLFLKG